MSNLANQPATSRGAPQIPRVEFSPEFTGSHAETLGRTAIRDKDVQA